MHKIQEKEFTKEDFSCEHLLCGGVLDDVPNNDGKWVRFNGIDCLKDTICILNKARDLYLQTKDKRFWWQMIQLLPSSYNQTRNVMMNYEVLANIYKSRKNHKLDEWKELCKWIENLPYSELICGTFGIATQKWVEDADKEECPGPGYVNVYGQWVPKEDHSNYENAIFNGECD